jgi:Raf kinase inhibitor-like YbhB/YbcL family protein
MELTVKSSAFGSNQEIPQKYGCVQESGESTNPSLIIDGVPEGTKSLALIVDDPDAPSGTFDHWVMWNIPPSTRTIGEDSSPGIEGLNGLREHGYTGPCPPSGTHRYFFKAYALDTQLGLGANSGKKDLEKAMKGHILAQGQLIGLYSKK